MKEFKSQRLVYLVYYTTNLLHYIAVNLITFFVIKPYICLVCVCLVLTLQGSLAECHSYSKATLISSWVSTLSCPLVTRSRCRPMTWWMWPPQVRFTTSRPMGYQCRTSCLRSIRPSSLLPPPPLPPPSLASQLQPKSARLIANFSALNLHLYGLWRKEVVCRNAYVKERCWEDQETSLYFLWPLNHWNMSTIAWQFYELLGSV